MTNDKRLQEIINRRPSRWRNLSIKEFERDIRILQQQAETAQKLEGNAKDLREALGQRQDQVKELEKENKQYREALEFYADRDNYINNLTDDHIHYTSMVGLDYGEKARRALEQEQ